MVVSEGTPRFSGAGLAFRQWSRKSGRRDFRKLTLVQGLVPSSASKKDSQPVLALGRLGWQEPVRREAASVYLNATWHWGRPPGDLGGDRRQIRPMR